MHELHPDSYKTVSIMFRQLGLTSIIKKADFGECLQKKFLVSENNLCSMTFQNVIRK